MIKGKQNSYERIADWSEWEVNGEDRNEQLKWNNENVTEEWEMLYWLRVPMQCHLTSPVRYVECSRIHEYIKYHYCLGRCVALDGLSAECRDW